MRPHPAAHLLFLLSIIGGGCLAAVLSGTWGLTASMGETYAAFFGTAVVVSLLLQVMLRTTMRRRWRR